MMLGRLKPGWLCRHAGKVPGERASWRAGWRALWKLTAQTVCLLRTACLPLAGLPCCYMLISAFPTHIAVRHLPCAAPACPAVPHPPFPCRCARCTCGQCEPTGTQPTPTPTWQHTLSWRAEAPAVCGPADGGAAGADWQPARFAAAGAVVLPAGPDPVLPWMHPVRASGADLYEADQLIEAHRLIPGVADPHPSQQHLEAGCTTSTPLPSACLPTCSDRCAVAMCCCL